MTKYIAFLRAINVGGHTVKMDHLIKLFEALGFSNVETFIASGNVIFETTAKNTTALEKKIGGHLEKSLGYEVDTFIRTVQEVADVEKRSPFAAQKKDDSVYVAFLHETPNSTAISALMALKNKANDFAILEREVYWHRLDKDDTLIVKKPLEKVLKLSATVRNLTTVKRIIEKYQ
jgi:uncharacterized protein (DUF1697 family)